jgi:glycosyltransferase involved in cell wall biosynthesis
MKVSIALAMYNGEQWLREQLDSLARQTLLPDELVVSDDQSTDRTLEVIEQFAGEAPFPVRVIRNDARIGFADNFMRALRHCTGEAVAYCDQDDVWSALKLERCVAAMRGDHTVTVVYHDLEEVDCNLRPLGVVLRPRDSPVRDTRTKLRSILRNWAAGCAMVVHRRLVDTVLNCWPEQHQRYVASSGSRGLLAHDCATLDIAAVFGTVVYLSDVLVQHRRHPQNTWSVEPDLAARSRSLPLVHNAQAAERSSRMRVVLASLHEEMADRARAIGDSRVASRLSLLADRDLKLATFHAGRALLYRSESRIDRSVQLSRMLHGGVYRGIGTAAGGIRSALKDMAFVFGGPRALRLLETTLHRLRPNVQYVK